jgi:GTPase involved in cell partitioning and DNA repair
MVDSFRLRAKGGDGGDGCVSIRRSRADRQGKPDGEWTTHVVVTVLLGCRNIST